MKRIVKRRNGHCEPYSEKKVYKAIYSACYVEKMGEDGCKGTAKDIAKIVTSQVKDRKEVSSNHIHRIVVKELMKSNKKAAFMFETHKDIG
jgi:transcriptional regulator NrdR family protein